MSTPAERIRDRIVADAAANDWLGLWPAITAARTALLLSLAGFSEEQALVRPPDGEGESAWSAIEIAAHVAAYSANVSAIIEATASGKTVPKDPPGTLRPDPTQTFAEVLRQVTEASVRLASLPERLPSAPNLTTTVPHAFFGPLNCREWYVFLRIHDADHTRQLERLRELPDFPPA